MAYEVYRSGKNGFRLYLVDYSLKPKKQTKIEHEAYVALGFSKNMSFEEAKARKNQINAERKVEFQKVINITAARKQQSLLRSAFLPPELIKAFEYHLEELGYDRTDKQKGKIFSRWNTVQKIILHLEVPIEKYARNRVKIYRWLEKNKYAPDTVKKHIRTLNMWSEFNADKFDRTFEPVKLPVADHKQAIRDVYIDSEDYRSESDPLSPEILEKIRSDLTVVGNYEWLFISIWFELRPGEVDNLKNSKNFDVKFDKDNKIDILWVYQSKLGRVDREKRWKLIPILYPEQQKALEYFKAKEFKRPLLKTLKKYAPGYITLYGGRKGFQDLMCNSKGRSIYEVSQWLGHQSIEMTLKRYRNRKKVALDKKIG